MLRKVGLVLGPAAFLALGLVPSALHQVPGFGSRPAWGAAVAAWMAVWWFTEAVPMGATACLPLILFPLVGVTGRGPVADAGEAALSFVDAYIFLFLGGMAVGAAMEHWNLHRRLALHIMVRVGASPRRLLLGMLLATATVSMWISNTATAVMMVPIGMAVVRELESRAGRRLAALGGALMLAVAYASNVGGVGTKIGTATNSIFAGFLSEKLKVELGFLTYMAAALPFVVLFLPLVWLALWRMARRDGLEGEQGREVLRSQLEALGVPSGQERRVAAVFGAAALLWVLGDPIRAALPFKLAGKYYEAGVAMSAAAVLASLRCLPLAALRRIPVSALLLLGGSFAMASGIDASGASKWLGLQLEPIARLPFPAQVLLATSASVVLSAIASNTATVTLLLNLLPPSVPLLTATSMAASCDFALPAGTPPNAIVFGSGYVRLPDMMRAGALLDVAAALVLAGYTLVWLVPLLG